jgi:hypothetical protein
MNARLTWKSADTLVRRAFDAARAKFTAEHAWPEEAAYAYASGRICWILADVLAGGATERKAAVVRLRDIAEGIE